jgi:aspartate/methionine/tyrosine aminotransferase
MSRQREKAAARMGDIAPFYVMDLLARAKALEAAGRSVVHMEVGEPDFSTPAPIVEAGKRALDQGLTHYTAAAGLPALRDAIAAYYGDRYGVSVDPGLIVVTPGASGALQLVMGTLVDPGDEVLLADPGYPCNRHFVRLAEGRAVNVAVGPETAYQLDAALVRRFGSPHTRAALVASPANPTGTVINLDALREIQQAVSGLDAHLVADEIYHGLVYGEPAHTALEVSDDVFIVNSFSKYFGMTGWRLGWLVAPGAFVEHIDRLAQNIFLSAPTPAQHAALVAFEPETLAVLEERRREFRRRRDFLLPALRAIGFEIAVEPAGAFYLYADCSRFTDDSFAFCFDLLEKAGVAITPGKDFGSYRAERHVRFAYTTGMAKLQEGVERLRRYLGG